MARPFKIEILEDVETLKKSLQQARSASQKERLQMLWWLKSGEVTQQQALGQRLGRNPATISRWLQTYRRGGLAALLATKKAPGRTWAIEGELLAHLETQLQQPQGFKSYGEIVVWFQQTFGKTVPYQTVYKTVRYRLQAKLKVPRPRSLKQDEASVALFKKTSP